MKAPLLIVGCADPDSVSGLGRLRSAGFVVEPIRRAQIPDHLERLALSTRERPDAVLLAAETNERLSRYGLDRSGRAGDLVRRIRDLPDRLCFIGDVRAKTVPVVLAAYGRDVMFFGDFIEELYHFQGRPPSLRWFHVCREQKRLLGTLREAIREWRHSLFEQLDYFGYAITRDDDGVYRVGHALLRRRRESDILAEGASLRVSPFYILGSDILDDIPAYRELEVLLNTFRKVAQVEDVQPETVLQRFFERHPHMLFQGEYSRLHPKPRIPIGNGWHEPDFVQEPRPLSLLHRRWGVTDLKLPDTSLLERRKAFHRGFSRAVHKAVDQLTDYRDLIQSENPRVRESLMRQLGAVPRRPRLAVVIGRRPEADDVELVARRAADLPVRVITYDDVLDDEAQRILLQLSLGAKP